MWVTTGDALAGMRRDSYLSCTDKCKSIVNQTSFFALLVLRCVREVLPVRIVKLNVEASYLADDLCASIGIVPRDHRGVVILSSWDFHRFRSSVEEGELQSCLTVLHIALVLQNPIINVNGKDIFVWKLAPIGEFSSKSAYKHCFNNLQLPPRQRPKIVPMQVISLLNQVWEDKQMAPRVQTFAWRLLRKALPTGKRAGRYSKHINENCSRCGLLEDEMHMLFLCPFSKAAWFCYPWFIKTESLAENYHSIPDMIRALITSQHPKINLTTLYTFLWCLWKTRNDYLFCSKLCKPSQVYASANAIIEATNLEDKNFAQQQESDKAQEQLQASSTTTHTHDCNNLTGNVIFCDAAWERRTDSELGHAGLGVIITMQDNRHLQRLHVSALSPPVSLPLQAETYGLLLATKLADLLQVQNPHFCTDCSVLVSRQGHQRYLLLQDVGRTDLSLQRSKPLPLLIVTRSLTSTEATM